MGKVWRPRRPAEAPLDDAQGVAVGKMRRPATKAPLLKSVAEKDAKRVVASVGVGVRGGETGTSLEDDGTAVLCLMEEISLDDRTAVGVKKDAKDVGKVWRPRKPAKKAPLKAVGGGGVKDTKGVDVIGIDGEVKASLLGAPMVMAVGGTEKGPPEDGIVMCRIDALNGAPVITTTRQKTVGLMKDARGVVVGKIWQPRRPPVKAPLKAVGVKDTEGVTVITVDGVVEASVPEAPVVEAANFMEKGPLEDGIAVCQMNSFNGAPVISTTLQEEVGVKSAEGVVVGKRRRPRRSAKKPLEALGVKNAEGVAVNTLIGKVKPLVLSVPVVAAAGGSENGSLEDGIVVCLVDALHGAPVIATDEKEEVSVQGAVVPVAGGREKGSLEDGIVVCRVDSLNGAPVIATDEKEEVSVLGVPMVAEVGDREKGPLEDGIVVCRVDALNAASVIATDEKEEVWVQGDPMVPAARGREKGSLEDGIVMCRVDTLDRALVISTTREEEVRVKSDEGVVVGKRRRPRRSVKKPLEALGVNDAEGVVVNTLTGEVEPLVLGVPMVTAVGGMEKGSLEHEIVVCLVDAVNGAPVIASDEKEEVSVQGDPMVPAAGGGENGSLDDVIVVCRVDTLNGAPVIATDEKEEVSVQGNPVFPAVDQKVDALVLERMQTITVKGNGKEEKNKEGIKWLKHYSTAQSILIIGDGDFSFSLALATTFGSGGNLVATSLDTYEALTRKYGKAESNVRELKRLGATVLHGVDAETMKLHPYLEMRRFDRIVFNFPHAGFKGKEYQLHVISSHKQLVRGFLANARQLLRPCGEIHLSHKKGFPYDAWGIKKLACESCLIMVRKVEFSKEDYPGYNQKRGDGVTCDDSFPLGPCWTFMFRAGDVETLKKAHGNRVGSISSCLGDPPGKCYPPSISATGMMWPFDLHPTWPQPHFPPVHMPIAFDPFNCYGTSFHHQGHQEQPCAGTKRDLQLRHRKNTRAFKTTAGGREKGSLEDGIVVCRVDALDRAPVISTTREEEVRVKSDKGVVVGKRRRPRRSVKKPLEALGVNDAKGVAVNTLTGEVEPLVLGVSVVAEVEDMEKGPLEDGIVLCRVDALNGAPVIATDEKEEVSAQGDPMVPADGGEEKGSLEDGIVVCRVDALHGAPIISTTRQEEVRVKTAEGVAVGKRRRPRRSAKKPLEALGVKDAEGVAVIALIGEVEPLVLGVPVVAAVGGREKGPLEDGIVVCQVDALNAAPVMATHEKEEVWVQEDPVVAEAGGGEKGSLEDGIVVCPVDTLNGDPFIATDEKEEVSVQGNPVFPTVDQKVDAPVLERMQTITVKGNGKEDKDKEGIKWLKHYSTAQSILVIGDGDFSFSLALATAFGSGGNLVATSLDSYEALTRKYGKAESNVRELKRLGATVLHGVDAETMKLHPYLEMRRFDRIVFNFPHAGFKGKEYQLHVISSHKQLVRGFLANARQLLRPCGEIHISHKKGFPYDAWGIKKLACESCLIMVRKVEFSKKDYPGYNQKRGDGVTCDDSFPLGPCWTFMFRVGDVEKLKKAHGNRVGLISSCLGDPGKCYPPGMSATSMMWPFDLHPAWPQPHFPPVHMPIAFNCYGTSFHHQHMVQPTHQEHPWYKEGPPIETPQEHQSLQREYEIHRQLMRSLEDRYMESVERQATLETLIQVYGRH